ncbi:MAG: sialidase family protein [Vicinamibacterales bacterium]
MPTFLPIPPRLNISKNVQVTYSGNINQARSESVVSINPTDGQNLIAASKRFRNIRTYDFIVEPSASFDGGKTWTPTPLALHRDWGVNPGMSDPTIAWDGQGWAYLFVGPHWKSNNPADAVGSPAIGIGVWVYISKDGGKSWGPPIPVSSNRDDDKQWAASDTGAGSPHYGNVYVAWGAETPLHFARSHNPGNTWTGPGGQTPAQSSLAAKTFGPEVSVGPDGTVYIFWHKDGSNSIELVTSHDGGQSFTAARTVVTGMTSIRGHAPSTGGWPHFPGGTFRVITLVTACVVGAKTLMVAWADYRDDVARIYFRRSTDGGNTWDGPASGQPLVGGAIASDSAAQEFHPQILALPNGTVGCAFYEFGYRLSDVLTPGLGNHLRYVIDVVLVASLDGGVTFTLRESVSVKPWNPRTGAPWAHGDPNVTFIGEYFGFDADSNGFRIVWTDTRTGMQELFSAKAYVQTSVTEWEDPFDTDTVFIPLHGSGGGVLFNRKTGKVVPVPYPELDQAAGMQTRGNPIRDVDVQKIDRLLDAFALIEGVSTRAAHAVKGTIMESIGTIAAEAIGQTSSGEQLGDAVAGLDDEIGEEPA